MYKQDLALNNLQRLKYQKNQSNPTKLKINSYFSVITAQAMAIISIISFK